MVENNIFLNVIKFVYYFYFLWKQTKRKQMYESFEIPILPVILILVQYCNIGLIITIYYSTGCPVTRLKFSGNWFKT